MKPDFYIYITTNPNRTVLYVGRTNNLPQRMTEHWLDRGKRTTFAGRHYCYNLIYWEETKYVLNSIEREKQLKRWSRHKKVKLLEMQNPKWIFLNDQIMEWPPKEAFHRQDLY